MKPDRPLVEPLISACDLAVHFRVPGRGKLVVRALDGVSLDWRRGEVLGIVGESGSGKSTLARAMLGLVDLTAGVLRVDGQPVSGRSERRELRQRVQMVFQDPYQVLSPRQSVRSIVAEPLEVRGVPKADREGHIRHALANVGLPAARFIDRHPHELSGGQRQRVAIAASIAMGPQGLICDEPVSMLDVSIRAQILELLLGLRRRFDMSLLFITHDLGLAWVLCDRVAVMYLGRIVEEGSAEQVIRSPRHPYTRALLEAIPSLAPDPSRGHATLKGEPPDPARVPSGCRFHPRCPLRFEPCNSEDPSLDPVADGHRVACLHSSAHADQTGRCDRTAQQ